MIFITGGTGLLGSHVLVELLKRGKSVRAMYRKKERIHQVENVFKHFFGTEATAYFSKIEWIEGDLLDVSTLDKGIKGCDTIYHCAALVSFKKRDFKRLMKINKEGTANVVNCSLSHNVERICYVSSTAAIGLSETKAVNDENNKWVKSSDNSNYAISKYSAENEIWRAKEEGLETVIINPSVILGVGDWNESSLTLFKAIKKGLKFFTPGANAFVDARDVAHILCELDERDIINDRFLVIGENLAFKELFELIADEFNVKRPSIKVKSWMAAIAWRIEGILHFFFGKTQTITRETSKSAMRVTKFSNEKIKKALNYEFVSIEMSVKHTVKYFKNKYV